MKPETVKDILEIIKNQNLDDLLNENDGIRKRYCQKIFKTNVNFFIKAVNNNLYEYLKKYYILREPVANDKYLKQEEVEIIKKYIIFNNLKSLDKATLDKLKLANDVVKNNMDNKIENNSDFRVKIIKFIKENDKSFYNYYIKKHSNLNDKNIQIDMVRQYNEYLKKIS